MKSKYEFNTSEEFLKGLKNAEADLLAKYGTKTIKAEDEVVEENEDVKELKKAEKSIDKVIEHEKEEGETSDKPEVKITNIEKEIVSLEKELENGHKDKDEVKKEIEDKKQEIKKLKSEKKEKTEASIDAESGIVDLTEEEERELGLGKFAKEKEEMTAKLIEAEKNKFINVDDVVFDEDGRIDDFIYTDKRLKEVIDNEIEAIEDDNGGSISENQKKKTNKLFVKTNDLLKLAKTKGYKYCGYCTDGDFVSGDNTTTYSISKDNKQYINYFEVNSKKIKNFMTAKQKDEKMQADIDKAKKELEIDAIEEEINKNYDNKLVCPICEDFTIDDKKEPLHCEKCGKTFSTEEYNKLINASKDKETDYLTFEELPSDIQKAFNMCKVSKNFINEVREVCEGITDEQISHFIDSITFDEECVSKEGIEEGTYGITFDAGWIDVGKKSYAIIGIVDVDAKTKKATIRSIDAADIVDASKKDTDKLEAEINELKTDIMEKKLQSELKKKESNIESLSDKKPLTEHQLAIKQLYKDNIAKLKDEIKEAKHLFDNSKDVSKRKEYMKDIENLENTLSDIRNESYNFKGNLNISAAPKVKEEVKKEQDTSKLPTNMENVEFKEYKNRPKDITPEQKESAIEAPQHIKDEFKELKKTIDDVTKLNSKYEEELSKLKEKYENPITEKSRKSESILKDIYHSAADVQRVNNVVKLSEDLYLGVIEKLNAINKVYDEKEQTKIDAIKEKIKGLNAELKEVQKELGKYTENLKEIKVFTMEASMSEVEIQASAIEEQEIMKDNESILDKIANNFKSFFHTLKDISISLATA